MVQIQGEAPEKKKHPRMLKDSRWRKLTKQRKGTLPLPCDNPRPPSVGALPHVLLLPAGFLSSIPPLAAYAAQNRIQKMSALPVDG